jgi:hypothetical protein
LGTKLKPLFNAREIAVLEELRDSCKTAEEIKIITKNGTLGLAYLKMTLSRLVAGSYVVTIYNGTNISMGYKISERGIKALQKISPAKEGVR